MTCLYGVLCVDKWLNTNLYLTVLLIQLQGPVIGDDEPEITDNNVDWSEPDNATVSELDMRAANVHAVCKKRNLASQPINNKEFFVDHTHSLVWCNIFKAASSSWLYNFNILGKKYLNAFKRNYINIKHHLTDLFFRRIRQKVFDKNKTDTFNVSKKEISSSKCRGT